MPSESKIYDISTWTLIRFFAIILGLGMIYLMREILSSLVFAVIVASAIEPAIIWFQSRRIPRILAVILIYLSIAVLLFFVIYLVFPLIFGEIENALSSYTKIEEVFASIVGKIDIFPFPNSVIENIEDISSYPLEYLGKLSGGISEFASTVFGGIFSLLLIVVFSFYLATQEKGIENFLRLITPLKHEQYILDLWQRSQVTLGRWFRVQMLLAAIVGIMIFFGLTFLGIKQAFIFAILAAIFEIIPVVGPIFAGIPAVLIAFLENPMLGLLTVGLYVLVQQIESNVIIPVIMKRAVGLSPLIVLLAILVGAKIGGIFGILLAVPVTAIIVEFISDLDKKKRALIPG